jgi:flagellar biosynthetic protein FlhB
MAEEQDDSQKTEAPSQHRVDEARKRGQVASSREVASFFLMGATLIAWTTIAPWAARDLTISMRSLLENSGTLRLDSAATGHLLAQALGLAGLALMLPLLLYLAAPITAAGLQNAILWSTESLGLKPERISPMSGAKRLFSTKALLELAKSLLKLVLAGSACGLALWSERQRIAQSIHLPLAGQLQELNGLMLKLLVVAAVVVALIAMLDYAQTRFSWLRQLRMTPREVMDEHKQNEGDPIIRQRLKSLRLQRARQRMMANVPKSTVVITNPTHFAVALRYVAGETSAPKILAKGTDEIARRIREVAREHKVPIVESPPLARALHAGCDVGDLIPAAHYQAVAEVIGYVLRLGGQQR